MISGELDEGMVVSGRWGLKGVYGVIMMVDRGCERRLDTAKAEAVHISAGKEGGWVGELGDVYYHRLENACMQAEVDIRCIQSKACTWKWPKDVRPQILILENYLEVSGTIFFAASETRSAVIDAFDANTSAVSFNFIDFTLSEI